MTAGMLLPLLACIGACAVAGAVIARVPRPRVALVSAAALGLMGAWTLLQLAMQQASDPERAAALMRLGTISVFVGPLALHLFVEANPRWRARLRRLLLFAYASSAVLFAVGVSTRWTIVEAVATRWGWGYRPGPGLVLAFLSGAGYVAAACFLVLRERRLDAATRPVVLRWRTALLVGVPLALGALTDFALPMLDVHPPLLGSACLVAVAAAAWFGARDLGYALLSPRTFANEILETLPDGVALLRGDHRIHVANGRLASLLSMPRPDVVGCSVDAFLAEPLPAASTGGADRPGVLRLPTGVSIPVTVATRTLADRQGHPIGEVLLLRDQREVVGLRARLVTSARMAALGELAAGIAHEVNNPVAFIQANLNLLARHLRDVREGLSKAFTPAPLPAQLGTCERRVAASRREVEQIATVVREVQGFAHAGPEGRVPADVNELVEAAARVAAPLLRDRVVLERAYGALPAVVCAPQQLKQLFLHLIVAGSRAPGTSRLRLATGADARCVHVVMECDEGAEPGALARLFDPFARGPGVAGGDAAEVGLAICEEIVSAHGGALRVEVERARVRAVLPVASVGDDGAEAC